VFGILTIKLLTKTGGSMNTNRVIEALQQVIVAIKEEPKSVAVETGRFKTLSDGWVLDKSLGIEWGLSSSKKMNWEEAKKYATEQCGHLPTVKELRSLVDYDRHNPAIDTQFFNDTKTDDWYWTGTEVAGYSGSAWVVGFRYGSVYNSNKDVGNYGRPVRASQCLIL
jgi:Protein of unknown function (DUF1566)